MDFIDLALQQKRIREKIEKDILHVLDHGMYIMGPEIKKLEEELAGFTGAANAIAVSSGTDALLLALMAYNVGPGDAIFTTPFTFIATAEVISLLGATPVFVDIDHDTFNIDPEKLDKVIMSLKNKCKAVSSRSITPRGVIAVDLFGLPADYDRINAIAEDHNLFVIEDAAQSFGAEYKGRKACSLASIGCTSFFPAKPLGCYGDGGMCFADDKMSEIISSLRIHGKGDHKYDNVRIGINGRIDTLQAAILLAKFEIFPEEVELRQTVANSYSELLANIPSLSIPKIPEDAKSVWAQYSILAKDEAHRSSIQTRLKNAGIPTAIYYPKPLHLQTAFASLGYKEGDFPVSESIAKRVFSIPMHPYLTIEDQKKISSHLEKG
ncbi:DegT/DnrJ/EryC1/StrS family aminotransferase [bacterium]|nr:DegT/DnrJ/EryC1/StrS family aminotransferase [bacterium]